MLEALFFFLIILPLLSPVLLIVAAGLVVHTVVVTTRGRRPRTAALWARLTAISLCVGLAVYGIGLWVGNLMWMSDPDDLCHMSGLSYSDSPEPSSMWPLHNHTCASGGVPVDLVPAYVNPVLYAAIGLFVVGVAGWVVSRLRRRQAV
ncbi:hypothetical protein [Planotetraspora mira]|uniref:Uncharacterized protein n=1 Tax=Planotetraspora mira TaxID=58121 RepID=A0A8J3TJY9_9ACTN|nr:hypothetical protein [Planotetraspora mira]GII28555.1 hypothetical protein Pmi06nite_19970 [Planotetraspora mira]